MLIQFNKLLIQFNKCLLNEIRDIQRCATVTEIQIQIKIDIHPTLGIKEMHIYSPQISFFYL